LGDKRLALFYILSLLKRNRLLANHLESGIKWKNTAPQFIVMINKMASNYVKRFNGLNKSPIMVRSHVFNILKWRKNC